MRKVSSKVFLDFEEKLRLDPCYSFGEHDIICELQVAFEREIMHTLYCSLHKRPDLCFSENKLAIEIDQYSHVDRDFQYEQSRQMMIEKNLAAHL